MIIIDWERFSIASDVAVGLGPGPIKPMYRFPDGEHERAVYLPFVETTFGRNKSAKNLRAKRCWVVRWATTFKFRGCHPWNQSRVFLLWEMSPVCCSIPPSFCVPSGRSECSCSVGGIRSCARHEERRSASSRPLRSLVNVVGPSILFFSKLSDVVLKHVAGCSANSLRGHSHRPSERVGVATGRPENSGMALMLNARLILLSVWNCL